MRVSNRGHKRRMENGRFSSGCVCVFVSVVGLVGGRLIDDWIGWDLRLDSLSGDLRRVV